MISTEDSFQWQFDYATDRQKLGALYEKAKKYQWNATVDIDFSRPVDPSQPIIGEDISGGVAFIPLMKRLSKSQQENLRAHLTAYRLSQFIHGEQGAMMTAAALTHAVPDHQAKLYSATQTMDEARHVEVFTRYLEKLGPIYPMSRGFKSVLDRTLGADHWIKIAIGMNMVVEGMAVATFHNMIAMTSCELLKEILRAVVRDESRHVAFGGLYVAEALAAMHPDDREEIADFTFEVVQLLRATRHEHANAEQGFLQLLNNVGIAYEDVLRSAAEMQQSGAEVQLPSQLVHPFKHLMMPALVRVGAVTERAKERYAEVGIPVWTDRAMLERMEQA